MKKILFLFLVFCLFLVSLVNASVWVKDANNCPTSYNSQDCAGSDVAAHYTGGILSCDDPSNINSYSTSGTTSSSAPHVSAGYSYDCVQSASSPVWTCDSDSSCYAKHRVTSCTGGTSNFVCTDTCISGYQNCTGTGLTYLGSDVDTASDSCNAVTGGNCDIDAGNNLYGVIGAGCTCIPSKMNFVTGEKAIYSTNESLLWGKNYDNTGALINISNDAAIFESIVSDDVFLNSFHNLNDQNVVLSMKTDNIGGSLSVVFNNTEDSDVGLLSSRGRKFKWVMNDFGFLLDNHRVGLGDQSSDFNPDATLHIRSSIGSNAELALEPKSGRSSSLIYYEDDGSLDSEVELSYFPSKSKFLLGSYYLTDIEFNSNLDDVNSSYIYMNATSKYIGINTRSPTHAFEVLGDVYAVDSASGNYGYLGSDSYGVYGYSLSGRGVQGYTDSGYGVYGVSLGSSSSAVYGVNTNSYAYGALGTGDYGAYGNKGLNQGFLGSDSYGVRGYYNTGSDNNEGILANNKYGVYGRADDSGESGVYGRSLNSYGVYGYTDSGYAVFGSDDTGNYGYLGSDRYGVYGYAHDPSEYAVYSAGNLKINDGTFSLSPNVAFIDFESSTDPNFYFDNITGDGRVRILSYDGSNVLVFDSYPDTMQSACVDLVFDELVDSISFRYTDASDEDNDYVNYTDRGDSVSVWYTSEDNDKFLKNLNLESTSTWQTANFTSVDLFPLGIRGTHFLICHKDDYHYSSDGLIIDNISVSYAHSKSTIYADVDETTLNNSVHIFDNLNVGGSVHFSNNLDVGGLVHLSHTTSIRPTCTSERYGDLYIQESTTTFVAHIYSCLRTGASTYEWKQLD